MAQNPGGEHGRLIGNESGNRLDERSKRTVLVVDDDDAFAESVKFWLRPEFSIRLAHDGRKAVEEYDPSVDVVLLDRRMPTVQGKEALEQIRAEEGSASVAIITAVSPDEEIMEMDFDAYLDKPVMKEDLVETVDRLLERREYSEDIQTLFRLQTKIELFQETYRDNELAESSQYQQLVTEFEETYDRAAEALSELDEDERRTLQQTAEALSD